MPKRPSKHLRPARPLNSGAFAAPVDKTDGQWMVQTMPADLSTKAYSCPGCRLTIAEATAHVVVWPREPSIGSPSALEERRHWHSTCWQRRR